MVFGMYKRSSQSWAKHLDFILWDILALQLAFILSYCIYNHTWTLPYADANYRGFAPLI